MRCKGRMGCGQCKECGCETEVNSQCVRIRRDYPAIGVTRGDTLEKALEILNTKFEELSNIQDGVGIEGSNIDTSNLLTFTLTNGEVIEAGNITIP